MTAVYWSDLAWPDLRQLFATAPDEVGLLPIGATEQHGPHLPTGTDTIIASALCEEVSARTGAPVLPPIAIGCSFGHDRLLPGTLSLSPEELATTARRAVEWAADSGLRRVLMVNAHFGNAAALNCATDHLRFERPELRVGVVGWWEADEEVAAAMGADGDDVHANRAETSLMLAIAPTLVHLDRLAGADDPDRTDGLVFRYMASALSTNGVTGRPSEATLELGKWLFERAVSALALRVERGRRETPPLVEHRGAEHAPLAAIHGER
jgi:creatinine amidohydrolase